MADDSVPLPYPNLKVPQWQYQIASVPRLRDAASTSFWEAVEKDGEFGRSRPNQLTARDGALPAHTLSPASQD